MCSCPKVLQNAAYPTDEQAKEATATGNAEAINVLPLVLRREALRERFERTKLKSPEQLPDLQEDQIYLICLSSKGTRTGIFNLGALQHILQHIMIIVRLQEQGSNRRDRFHSWPSQRRLRSRLV